LELGRNPSEQEVVEKLGWGKRMLSILDLGRVAVSLDQPWDEDGSELGEIIVGRAGELEEIAKKVDQGIVLALALEKLSSRDREILSLRYGFEDEPSRTLEEAGQILGLSRERIRQIEARALKKLRGHLELSEGSAWRILRHK